MKKKNKALKRITINSIAKAMEGEWVYLNASAHVYPLTSEYVKSVVESVSEFHKRKILFYLKT
ncbi:hypothetical protein [Bacillus mycoides]|uniref:hypothetical protein n=1 Tax=Bacillus mycoides TaxID=1405 RepID=UPI00256FEEE4|nr:hypothetical protein [Bacillus mycoides]